MRSKEIKRSIRELKVAIEALQNDLKQKESELRDVEQFEKTGAEGVALSIISTVFCGSRSRSCQ